MPELPDVTVYIEALQARIRRKTLRGVRLSSPFVLRTLDPPITEAVGKRVDALARLGKRIVIGLESELFLVLHLMIAGRLQWTKPGTRPPGKRGLAAFDFDEGTLLLTEAGSKKRASLHVVRGESELAAHDFGGLEVLECTTAEFRKAITASNRALKRTLTDPHILSGIGNAYSDEILHRARLSPFTLTGRLDALLAATRSLLREWTDRLRARTGDGFPDNVTTFRPEMAVHGRHGKPCPVCGDPVQRIAYASSEANYCATCQTGGKLLADRALSRLLKKDWPRAPQALLIAPGRRPPPCWGIGGHATIAGMENPPVRRTRT